MIPKNPKDRGRSIFPAIEKTIMPQPATEWIFRERHESVGQGGSGNRNDAQSKLLDVHSWRGFSRRDVQFRARSIAMTRRSVFFLILLRAVPFALYLPDPILEMDTNTQRLSPCSRREIDHVASFQVELICILP
jgi:hypothetical protein